MKRSIQRTTIIAVLLITFFSSMSSAQVTLVSDGFDDGNISSSPAWTGNTTKFTVSSSSPLEGAYSLRSNSGNTPSSISTQYGTNTNLTNANYTWTLLYRDNGSGNPDELPYGNAINSGNNHWRFWIAANSTNATSCDGFYISHSAGNLKFCRKYSSTWDITTFPISLNTTYSIKINRRTDGYWYLYIDAGTGEATTLRWEGWATDVFNSGSSNIFMLLHSNETTTGRFQWDRAGMTSKSLSIAQLTQGIATGDLEEGMTNKALFGFSASASGGNITLKEVTITNTNSNNGGVYTNTKLYTSVDNDYSTAGDNTEVSGASIILNGTKINIKEINHLISSGTSKNYFLVTDIAVNTSGSTPPANMQFSLSCNSCGASNTNVVTDNGEKVNDFSFSGTNYNFLRVFMWRNTSTVGDYTDDWQNASAWEPYRNSPSATDILKFSKGGSVTPLNIPNETVKKLIITGNTTVNILHSSIGGNRTITVNGGSEDDFVMDAGSVLNITSNSHLFNISLPSGVTAAISGAITISGKNHTLSGASANSIVFKNGSVITGGSGLSAIPFANGASNSVRFESGSVLVDEANLDYLVAGKVSFQPGSTYRITFNAVPYLDGKTYANFEINNASFNRTISGSAGFTVQNFTVTSASSVIVSNTGTKTINGNVAVTAGSLSFSPGSASALIFNGNGVQTISGAGTLTFGSTNNITVASTSNLYLSKDISFSSALTLNGKITINTQILTLSGTITGTGTLSGSASSDLVINGTGSFGTIYFDQSNSSTKTLRNITLNRTSNGTVSLGNAMELINVFTLTSGTFASAGNLTLLSSESGTARVSAITGGGITGDVTVQRYIPGGAGKRRYRTISSPVNVSGSVSYAQLIDDTHITNPGAPANGFDQSPQQNASAFMYDETQTGGANTGWIIPTNVSNTIPTGRGVMITIRGNRSTPNPFNPTSTPNNCTLDFIGTINSGTISPAITFTSTGNISNDGWNLVGNPYPSPISWSAVTRTRVSSTVYIYNPNTGTYGTYNGLTGTNGATAYIASGQAFFIKATSANPVITFNENSKTANTPSNLYRTSNITENQLTLMLYKDSLNSDEAVIGFSDTSSSYSNDEDALKFMNGTINIYTKSSDNADLAINYLKTPVESDTIPVSVTGANGNYEFRIKGISSLTSGSELYLLDKYTNSTYEIVCDTAFSFAVNTDASSKGDGRFQLIFKRTSAPLPVKLISYTGTMKDRAAELKWITASEFNNDHFTIERSKDGRSFETIATVKAAKNGNQINQYMVNDDAPFEGINYYRLNQYDKDGQQSLSRVISLDNRSASAISLSVFPNPATDYINIRMSGQTIERIDIVDMNGKIVLSNASVQSPEVIKISCGDLPKGIYLLKISGAQDIQTTRFFKD